MANNRNPITFKVDNYRKAADSHLKACHKLFDDLVMSNNNLNEAEALHDIYYLCGYIFEGYCNYSIYKLYGWDTTIPINESGFEIRGIQMNTTDQIKYQNFMAFWRATQTATKGSKYRFGSGFCYDQNICPLITNNPYKKQHAHFVAGHRFDDNIQTYLHSKPEFNGVPYFSTCQINTVVESLIKDWKPEKRYDFSPDIRICRDNITEILNICDIIKKTIYNSQI